MTRDEFLNKTRGNEDPFLKQGSKITFHNIKEGKNKYRFYPAHPQGANQNFMIDKKVTWMEVEQDKRDENGKVVPGQKQIGRKPIYDAVVHGGLSNDPVELYIEYAKNKAIPNFTQNDNIAKGIMDELKNGMKKGIFPTKSKVAYADEYTGNGKTFGVSELKYSISSAMREEAKKMLGSDGPVVNIWTDLEEGLCAIITKDSVAGKSDPKKYYSVEPESQMVGKYNKQFVPTPLDEDDFNKFISAEPLENIYNNKYTMSDFTYQMEGLQRFDAYLASIKYPINVFEYDEFLEQINAVRGELEAKIATGALKENHGSFNDSSPSKVQASQPETKAPVKAYTEDVATPRAQPVQQVVEVQPTQDEIDRAEFEAFKAAQRAKQAVQAPTQRVQEVAAVEPAETKQEPSSGGGSIKERFAALQSKIKAGQ